MNNTIINTVSYNNLLLLSGLSSFFFYFKIRANATAPLIDPPNATVNYSNIFNLSYGLFFIFFIIFFKKIIESIEKKRENNITHSINPAKLYEYVIYYSIFNNI